MFWGVTLENGKRYSQVVDHMVRISMASLDPSTDHSSDSAKPVTVMIDHEKAEFVLCTLIPGKIFQQPLDLQFAEGEEVTLFLNGQGIVHLTGYEDDSEPDEGDMGDSDDDLSASELTDDQLEALIRARNKMGESGDARSLKRKAIEQSPKGSANKHLKRDESDESDDDDDDDDDDDEDDDDEDDESDDQVRQPTHEDDDDDESGDDSSEDFSDDDLYVKTPSTDKRGPNATPGKGLAPATFNKKSPPKQQQQQQKQTPKNTPKPPTLSGQTPKGQQGKTPKGQPAQAPKGQPGQSPKGQPGQSPKKGAGQQNAPKTPATNGNTSLNETESAKKKRKRQKKKKNDGGSPTSNVNSSSEKKPGPEKKQGSEKKPAKFNEATPSKERPKQTLPGGVVIEDVETGNGPVAKAGKFVHVYYTGRLANGKEFDSTGDGKPFKFRLGSSEVIKGWDVGLQGMKVGGTRKLTIPPSQGYGNKSIGKIPSNSTLLFDIRLAAVN